jgi:hypothetical protein
MTIHWKALDEQFLMTPLLFRPFDRGKCIFWKGVWNAGDPTLPESVQRFASGLDRNKVYSLQK